jgi:hypothetical protein
MLLYEIWNVAALEDRSLSSPEGGVQNITALEHRAETTVKLFLWRLSSV